MVEKQKGSSLPSKMTTPYAGGMRHLLDDSVLEESPCGSSEGSLPGVLDTTEEGDGEGQENLPPDVYTARYEFEGSLKRKTLLKSGKKPMMSSWTRYWVAICKSSLFFFPVKTLRGTQRQAFKTDPCKMMPLSGCMVVVCDDPEQPDAFQITDHVKGKVYKFLAGTKDGAHEWVQHLIRATKAVPRQAPDDLMTFE